MARKPLLTESEIRSFMKLAELRPIGDDKIAEMYGKMPGARDDEDELEDELDATEDELGAEDKMADDEADEMDDMKMDMDMDMDMDAGADAGGKMVSVDDFMSALEGALEDVLGEPVSTEMDDDGDVDMDMDKDVEMDADAAMDAEEDEMEMDMMEEEEEDEPGMMEEDIVNEVARRVASRLQAKNAEETMIDSLAEQIMKRLTK